MAQLNDLLVLGNSNLLGALSVFGDITAPTFIGELSGNASTASKFSSNATVQLTGDVTGSASSQKGWNLTTTLANSGVTAGSYGPSSNATLAHSGTFSVPYYTVDSKGRITASSTITYTLPASGNTDKKVEQARSASTNWRALLSHYTDTTQGTDPGSATNKVYYNEKLSFQPSTGSLYSAGDISAGGLLSVTGNGTFGGDVTVQGGDITITKSTSIANNYAAKLTFTVTQTDNNQTASAFIAVYDDHDSSNYGTNMVISSPSGLVIGGGESAANFYAEAMKDSAREDTYITADSNIDFYANCNTIGNRVGLRLDTSRQFYPILSSAGGAGSLGTNNYYWNKAYLGETHFKSGHIYLEGAESSSSTGNTTQLIFGTADSNHVCVSSNDNALIINPTASTTTNQIVLYLDKVSQFPKGVNWAVQATWASRLGDPGINVGNASRPVYFSNGVPEMVTAYKTDDSAAAIKPSHGNEINFGSNTNYIYFGYDNRIGSSGVVDTYMFGTHSGASNSTKGIIKCGSVETGNISLTEKVVAAQGFRVSQTDGSAGYGLSLYGSAAPYTYGVWFGKTETWGKHGSITGDWATYFGMSNTAGRGWIFRKDISGGCVASISTEGHLAVNGTATIGNGVTLEYNSTNKSLNFVFIS